MHTARRAVIVTATLLAASMTLIGCSGSSPSGSPSKAASSAKIMIAGQFSGVNPYTQGQQVSKVLVDRLNKSGGLGGHQLEVVYCDDKRDANVAAQCARQAVQEGVAAYLSLEVNFTDVVYPVLDAAGIPVIKGIPTNAPDFADANVWPVMSGAVSYGGASGVVMAKDKCKAVGVITWDSTSSLFLTKAIGVGYKTNGGKGLLPTTTVPTTTADYTPVVASLIAQKADCLGLAIPPSDTLKVGQALAAAKSKIHVYAALGVISPAVVTELNGSIPVTVFSDYPVLNDAANKELKDYQADTKKATNAPPESYGANGWWTTLAFAKIIEPIKGDITAKSVIKQLGKTSDLQLPGTKPIDYTSPFTVKGYERLFNRYTHVSDADGPNLVERKALADVTDFYKALAG